MNLSQFAASRNIRINTVSNYLSRHPEIKVLTKKVGKETELSPEAIELLDKVYPIPKPVQVIQGVPQEDYNQLLNKYAVAQEQLAKAQEKIAELQEVRADHAQLIAEANAQKLLLEDRERQLTEEKARTEKAEKHSEELMAQLEKNIALLSERNTEVNHIDDQSEDPSKKNIKDLEYEPEPDWSSMGYSLTPGSLWSRWMDRFRESDVSWMDKQDQWRFSGSTRFRMRTDQEARFYLCNKYHITLSELDQRLFASK